MTSTKRANMLHGAKAINQRMCRGNIICATTCPWFRGSVDRSRASANAATVSKTNEALCGGPAVEVSVGARSHSLGAVAALRASHFFIEDAGEKRFNIPPIATQLVAIHF